MSWLMAGMALVLGLWWRDCVLLGAGALLGLHAFRVSMDRGAPWDALRGAVRCLLAGVLSLSTALALLGWVASVLLGTRAPPDHAVYGPLTVLALAAIAALLGEAGVESTGRNGVPIALVVAAAISAELLVREGLVYAGCAFAGVSVLMLAGVGWHLARELPSAFLLSGQRHCCGTGRR